MKIQLKRSSVLDSGSAKQPEAAQLEYGELAVNYNSTDPAIFLKASDNSIVQIAGAGSTGAFSGNYDDLTNKPTIGDGTITLTNDGVEVGTFTVNQVGDTTLAIPATDWTDINNVPLYIQATAPNTSTATNGDLWVDLGECPPELKVFSDCDGTAEWRPIEGVPELIVLATVLSGTAQVGQTIQSTIAEAIGGKAPYTFTYKFIDSDGSTLQNTTSNTYTVTSDSIGKNITVAAVGTDARGTQVTGPASNVLGPVIGAYAVNTPTLITPAKGSVNISATALTMTCTAFSGTATTYKQTQWQIASDAAFQTLVLDVTNTKETTFTAVPNPALNYETVYYARCRQISNEGVTSQYSTDNSFTTGVNPVNPNVPSATMSGLRFDSTRETNLQRGSSSGGNVFTWSAWAKPTSLTPDGNGGYLFTAGTGSTDAVLIGAKWKGMALYVMPMATQHSLLLMLILGLTLLFNTMEQKQKFMSTVAYSPESRSLTKTDINFFRFGGYNNTLTNKYDGYLSEAYFVDGYVKPPETFGKYFPNDTDPDKRWGPLDSTVIEAAINTGPIQPYDTRANTSQVWSSQCVGNSQGGTTPVNAFNGTTTDNWLVVDFGVGVWNASLTGVTKLEMQLRSDNIQDQLDGGTAITVSGEGIQTTAVTSVSSFTEIPLTSSTLGSITITGIDNVVSAGLSGVKINGRLLVDQGYWKTSQNWSDYLTPSDGYEPGMPAVQGFDGNESTRTGNGRTVSGDLTLSTTIDVTSKIEVLTGVSNKVYINGALIGTSSSDPSWVESTGAKTVTEVKVEANGTGTRADIFAIKVDGAILVDAGEQWNSSQIWSSGGGYLTGGAWLPVFNGDTPFSLSTANGAYLANNDSTPSVYTFPSSVSGELKVWATTALSTGSTFITLNTGESVEITGGTNAPAWYSFGAVTGVTTMTLGSPSNTDGIVLGAVELDGEILVDKSNFGANGFYLPFDPSNTGENWSSSGWSSDNKQPLSTMFDSNITTYVNADVGTTLTWTVPSIPIGSGVRVAGQTGASGDKQVKLTDSNGGTAELNLPVYPNAFDWVNAAGLTGNLVKLEIFQAAGDPGVSAIEVDGVVLVDHSSIGVDASGNNNDFYDQNFGVGNTSQVWSSLSNITGNITNGLLYSVFSGIEEGALPGGLSIGAGAVFTFNIPSSLFTETTNSLLFGGGATGNLNIEVKYDSTTLTNSDAVYSDGGNSSTYVFSIPQNKNVEFKVTGVASSNWINMFVVNNVLLVDPFSLDTVTDTPVMAYAVLNQATNGNLSAASKTNNGTTSTLAVVDKVYAECMVNNVVNGTSVSLKDVNKNVLVEITYGNLSPGNLIGVTVDSDTGSYVFYKDGVQHPSVPPGTVSTANGIYIGGNNEAQVDGGLVFNFGQQPFAASNVTYDQATGIVTLNNLQQPYDYRANTSQVWSSGASGSFSSTNIATNAFDGSRNFAEPTSNSTVTFTFTPALTGTIEILSAKTVSVANGIVLNSTTNYTPTGANPSDMVWDDITSESGGSLNSITLNTTADVGGILAGIKVDGRILVDQGVWDDSQQWSDATISGTTLQPINNDPITITSVFDGDMITGSGMGGGTDDISPTIWTLQTPVSYTSKVEFNVYTNSSGMGYHFNGNNVAYSGDGWVEVATGSGSLTSLGVYNSNSAGVGTITIQGVKVDGALLVDQGEQWNTSQVWSNSVVGAVNPEGGFNGSNTEVEATSAGTDIVFTPNLGASSFAVVVVVNDISSSPNNTVTIDGTALTAGTASSSREFTGTVSSFNAMTISSASGKANFKSVTVNGKILVDSDIAVYSTLFETWDEGTVTGIYYYDKNQSKIISAYELNKTYGLRAALTSAGIHNLEFQPTRTVLDYISCDGTTYLPIEDTSTGLRTVTALNSDLTLKLDRLETAFEAVLARVFALDSVEIGPLAINGYYPLYYTAAGANAASPTTTNHTHIINGITYYMPDGVTIYHGNYGSSSSSSGSSGGSSSTPSSGGGGSYY